MHSRRLWLAWASVFWTKQCESQFSFFGMRGKMSLDLGFPLVYEACCLENDEVDAIEWERSDKAILDPGEGAHWAGVY